MIKSNPSCRVCLIHLHSKRMARNKKSNVTNCLMPPWIENHHHACVHLFHVIESLRIPWVRFTSPKMIKMEFYFYPLMKFLIWQQREKMKKNTLFHICLCALRHFFSSHHGKWFPTLDSEAMEFIRRWNLSKLYESCLTYRLQYFWKWLKLKKQKWMNIQCCPSNNLHFQW